MQHLGQNCDVPTGRPRSRAGVPSSRIIQHMPNNTSTAILLAAAAAIVAAPDAVAQTRPASFDAPEEERRLERLIKFPEVTGNVSVMLDCFAQVLTTGKMSSGNCYMEDKFDQPFAQAVYDAAKKARMLPATIDGSKKKVFFQYRVEFVQHDDEQTINLFPNVAVAENLEEYGPQHFSAQRVIGRESWQKTCPKRARYLILVRAHVDMEGTASSVSLEHGGGIVPTGPCQQAIIDTVLSSRYTPAMIDGEPVPSTFVEPFAN